MVKSSSGILSLLEIIKRSLSWTIGNDLEIDSIDGFDGEKAKQIHRRYGLQQF